ncbi:ephrin-A4 isoform X2 [Amphiprion ocellaris]|uniref:ephrin-A4 isoform X2 n=1 Tax=Amphiprion ocellaris TaxID=80972 RepID=UPI00241143B2|nr:ephrin-A4 isoform X2 [Amphiprion ocellaris]
MNGHSLWQRPHSLLQHHAITVPSASRRRATHCGRESLSSAAPPNHKAISGAEELHPDLNPTGLTAGDLSIQLNLNDYLDIYCPHYPNKEAGQPETLALYLVAEESFQGCVETRRAIKRWECNTPYAPFGPVRFSEKIQRFTPFSLGFEFLPGKHYYYSSLPTDEGPPLPCMKLRVTVCCKPKTGPLSSVASMTTASLPFIFILLLLTT